MVWTTRRVTGEVIVRSPSAWIVVAFVPLLVLVMPSRASAQGLDWGGLGGIVWSNVSFDPEDPTVEIDRRVGGIGGVAFNTRFRGDIFSIEADALISSRGADFREVGGGSFEQKVKLTYLEFPVLARGNIGLTSGGYIEFGPSFNFKLREKFDPEDFDTDDDQVETFEFAVLIGGGVKFTRIRMDLRYGWGLTNIAKDADDGEEVKNQYFSLMFGFEL